ncbi:MAG: DNA-directed RNA polymerase subunit H [Candidatus Micrarchaeaceae archaeon]
MRIPKLIPEHRLLSVADAKKAMKKYSTPLEKFPKILESDAQVKKLGAKPGNLIAIDREDPTGKYTYYRLVVKG